MNNQLTIAQQNGQIGALTNQEQLRLIEYESQIERGFEYLHKIKNEGLWREYGTFENYFVQRWVISSKRRQNQILAGFRVYEVLSDQLPGTAVPNTEFTLRPLVTLAMQSPETAAEVYGYAIELNNGDLPTHENILLAKKIILTPEEIARKEAIDQINGLRFYNDYVIEIRNGADPKKILSLVVAYESCEIHVRRRVMRANVRDLALIRMINQGYVQYSETAQEVLDSGFLQFAEIGIPLSEATARDYRRLLDIAQKEHQARERELKRGQALSVLIYRNDPQATLESLQLVMDYAELLALGNLIGQI